MSKVISEDIHQLIHALSKSEKRFFKLYAARIADGRGKKFTHLFDCIAKQKIYNEEKILARNKVFTKKQFPNLKVHLYNQVLRSLSIVSSGASLDIQLHYLMGQALLLYNKCLYQQSTRILEKAKKLALANNRNILVMDIVELEKKIMLHTVSVRTQDRIDRITKEAERTSDKIRRADIFSNLSLRLNAFYMSKGFIRNRKDFLQVQRFFEKALPAYREDQLSFHDRLYLYYCFTGYYFFIQDFRKGYSYCKKMVALFEKEPHTMMHNLEMYIKVLDSKLMAENKLFLYPEFYETHKKLIALKRSPFVLNKENVNLDLFKTIYIHEMNRHFMLGEFTSGTRIVAKLEKELEHFISKLDKHTILIFYYKIACLYFGASNFRTALKWLNKIINSREKGLREDIHAFARILSLICHYELGHRDLLEYSIKSTYRFLLQKGDLNKYQRYILHFLRDLDEDTTEKQLKGRFIELRSELVPLENHKYEKRPFLYFDIISWLESKIHGEPVEKVIKAKMLKRDPR